MKTILVVSRLHFLIALLLFTSVSFAQVSINGTGASPDSSAMLDIQSDTRGILIPRMDSNARKAITDPAEGLMVYDSTYQSFYYYADSAWQATYSRSTTLSDADADTRIEVEESSDEDVIHMYVQDFEMVTVNSNGTVNLGKELSSTQLLLSTEDFSQNIKSDYVSSTIEWDRMTFKLDSADYVEYFDLYFDGGNVNSVTLDIDLYKGDDNSGTPLYSISDTTLSGFQNAEWVRVDVPNFVAENGSYNIRLSNANYWVYFLVSNNGGGNRTNSADFFIRVNGKPSGYLSSHLIVGENNLQVGDYYLPYNDGDSENILATDGAGNLSWYDVSELQTYPQISRSGLTVTLENGGSFLDSVLTESKVVEMVETNLLSTDETLGDSSNSAIPTEAAVKYYVDNSITNAYQTLSLIEDTLFISGGDHSDFQADLSSLKTMATAGNTNIYSGTGNFASLDENTSTSNTAIGRSAMNAFQSGNHNTAMGRYSLLELENANYNTSMGSSALREATDTDNQTAMGYSALREHKHGSDNVALGNEALRRASGGSYNVALGSEAMAFADSGSYNIALGYESLNSIDGADSNIAIGSQALNNLVNGNANVAIGAEAAQNYTGKASVFLGHHAGAAEASTDSVLYIANSNTSAPLIGGDFNKGKVGIGRTITEITGASEALQVNGDASKTTAGSWIGNSDKRLKTNISYMDADQILQQVLNMKGVTYEWNDTVTGYSRPEGTQYGFIAQDLQQVWPSKISEDDLGYLKTAYGDYDPMFVEAIKALYAELQQTKQINQDLVQKLNEGENLNKQQTEHIKQLESSLNGVFQRLQTLENSPSSSFNSK